MGDGNIDGYCEPAFPGFSTAEDIDHSDVDASQKKLDIDNVQKALMDLGLFPTLKELRKIHNQFTVGKNLLGKSNFHRSLISQVGELEFIKMVEFLTLEEISDKQFEPVCRTLREAQVSNIEYND